MDGLHNTVQEAMIKTIPKKKKCKKRKQVSEKDLQMAEKEEKLKAKEKKERLSHLNAELQRIARRKKKAFLRLLSRDGSPSLPLLSLFLSFIFCLPPFEDNRLPFWVPDVLC